MLVYFPGFSGGVEQNTVGPALSALRTGSCWPPSSHTILCPGFQLGMWLSWDWLFQRKERFLSSEPWVELFLQVWSQERIAVSFSICIEQ